MSASVRTTALAAALLAGSALSGAQAAPVTFFGEDLSASAVLAAFPNSDAARAAFFSNLVGVGTETFDTIAAGTGTPLPIGFGAAGTATISGAGTVVAGFEAGGRYPISPDNFWSTGTGSFTVTFSAPIAAFGFYGVDIGDYGASLSLTLTDTAANVTNIPVPHTIGAGGSTSHSVIYFGFYDTTTQYTSLSITNTLGGSTDNFGFDSFSVGSIDQVVPAPEPMSMALFGLGLAGLGIVARRRRA